MEAELIEEIVTTVWTRLQPKLPTFRDGLVNESTQGIVLELWHLHHEARWHPEGFSNMEILRLLILSSNLHLPLGLKCLSSGLKVLVWRECPLNALPLGVPLDELVRLEMPHSNLKQLWNGMQVT
ncbi:hypothetical protein Ahy_A07g031645 isoform C [Arachis hypogaea]|uniref:Uncharacterized protein n=1 Tax=Arachis hypogaea TaxID=3818 RepID=A0A445C4P3_ARAHY|nr:hypothetical protein Ahy_A07g031645 isoform C [Arachis hypogaea]